MDNLFVQSKRKAIPQETRQRVLGKKEARLDITTTWVAGREKNARQRAYGEKLGKQNMPQCSRCKLVRYCDSKCQRAVWPMHKNFCERVAST